MPEWTYQRPFISNNYLVPGFEKVSDDRTISSFKHKNIGKEKKKLGLMNQ